MSFLQVTLNLTEGFLENCRLFFETLLFSIPLGLIISFGSMSKFKPLKWLVKTFVWIIRGTPLMLQLFVVLYVPGLVFGVPMRDRMLAALVAIVINYIGNNKSLLVDSASFFIGAILYFFTLETIRKKNNKPLSKWLNR